MFGWLVVLIWVGEATVVFYPTGDTNSLLFRMIPQISTLARPCGRGRPLSSDGYASILDYLCKKTHLLFAFVLLQTSLLMQNCG